MIITLSPEAHHRALEFTRAMAVEVIYWPTPDPTATQGSRETMLQTPIAPCAIGSRRASRRF